MALKENKLKKYSTVVILGLLGVGFVFFLMDAFDFHRVMKSDYKTPWYNQSWLNSPYTNLRLSMGKVREYETKNAVGSEWWLVKEVEVGDKVFWTTLKRVKIEG